MSRTRTHARTHAHTQTHAHKHIHFYAVLKGLLKGEPSQWRVDERSWTIISAVAAMHHAAYSPSQGYLYSLHTYKYVRTYVHTYTLSVVAALHHPACSPSQVTCTRKYIRTYIHANAYVRMCMPAVVLPCIRLHILPRKVTCIRTQKRTYERTYVCTYKLALVAAMHHGAYPPSQGYLYTQMHTYVGTYGHTCRLLLLPCITLRTPPRTVTSMHTYVHTYILLFLPLLMTLIRINLIEHLLVCIPFFNQLFHHSSSSQPRLPLYIHAYKTLHGSA